MIGIGSSYLKGLLYISIPAVSQELGGHPVLSESKLHKGSPFSKLQKLYWATFSSTLDHTWAAEHVLIVGRTNKKSPTPIIVLWIFFLNILYEPAAPEMI